MKIYTRVEHVWDDAKQEYVISDADTIDYTGPLALCDSGGGGGGGSSAPPADTSQTKLTDPARLPYFTKLWDQIQPIYDSHAKAAPNPFNAGNMTPFGGGPVSNWVDRNGQSMTVQSTGPIDWQRYFGDTINAPIAAALPAPTPTNIVPQPAPVVPPAPVAPVGPKTFFAAAGGPVRRFDAGGSTTLSYETTMAPGAEEAATNAAATANDLSAFTAPAGTTNPYQQDTSKFTDSGIAESYMNPYQQNVTDISIREAQRADAQRQIAADAKATQAGAFGGYRQGIENAEGRLNEAQLESDIGYKGRADAYDKAYAAYNQDTSRNQTGEAQNAQFGLQSQLANLDNQYRAKGIELSGGQLNAELAKLGQTKYGIDTQNDTAQRAQDLSMSQFQTTTTMQIIKDLAAQYGDIQRWPADILQKALQAVAIGG
jgi:hypothetical protein